MAKQNMFDRYTCLTDIPVIAGKNMFDGYICKTDMRVFVAGKRMFV